MFRYLLSIFWLLICSYSLSQNSLSIEFFNVSQNKLDSIVEKLYQSNDSLFQNVETYEFLCDRTANDNCLKWTWRFFHFIDKNQPDFNYLFGRIYWRLGNCYTLVDNERAREFYELAFKFYSENNSNYIESAEFFLTLISTGLYRKNDNLFNKVKDLATNNADSLLMCRVIINESLYFYSAEKFLEAKNKILEFSPYLPKAESYHRSQLLFEFNLTEIYIRQKLNLNYAKNKNYFLENSNFLLQIREKSLIEYCDYLFLYPMLFGYLDPLSKSLIYDAKTFFEMNKNDLEYERVYFDLYLANYLLQLGKYDEVINLCESNLSKNEIHLFFKEYEQFQNLIKRTYELQGNILEYSKVSEYGSFNEKYNGDIEASFSTKSIQELFFFRKASVDEKNRYLNFLLSQCSIWYGSNYELPWLKGAKRDVAFLFGKKSLEYSLVLKELSHYYFQKNNYKIALKYINRSYNIDGKILPFDSEDLYETKASLITILLHNNKFEDLDTLIQSTANYYISKINRSYLSLNPNELLTQKKSLELFYLNYLNFARINNKLDSNILLLSRYWSALNGISNSKIRRIIDELNTNLKFQDEAQIVKELQSQLDISNCTDSYILSRNQVISDSLYKIFHVVELELIRNSMNSKNTNVLPEVHEEYFLVDICRLAKSEFQNKKLNGTTSYLIFIKDYRDSLIDYLLVEEGDFLEDEIYSKYMDGISNFPNKLVEKDTILYHNLWKPISTLIGEAGIVYISLGGVYNKINLNTIYNPTTGKYLIEEYDIRIVNSARDFVQNRENEQKIFSTNSAVLFGYPNFDGNTSSGGDTIDFFTLNRNLNSFWIDSLTRGGLKVNPLPGTKKEINNISHTLNSHGWNINSYTENDATESNLKKISSPRVLHIASHGYFFSDIPQIMDNNRFLGMDRNQVIQDPMLRSGLLFAGANRTLSGEKSTGENGMLSAAEASLLDLRETELVVLSACETGRGEETNSEGVYGLRKAFADAGAQNIIMSLWKVDDKVTQEFMSRFYEIWLNDKTTIREAFNRTQLEIKSKYPEPYYWGAFILVGE
jgi:CHAT domain-containing protein